MLRVQKRDEYQRGRIHGHGFEEIVEMLLQHKNIQINLQDEDGDTALMYASMYGHKKIVQMLLQFENIEINKDGTYTKIMDPACGTAGILSEYLSKTPLATVC